MPSLVCFRWLKSIPKWPDKNPQRIVREHLGSLTHEKAKRQNYEKMVLMGGGKRCLHHREASASGSVCLVFNDL